MLFKITLTIYWNYDGDYFFTVTFYVFWGFCGQIAVVIFCFNSNTYFKSIYFVTIKKTP